MNLPGTGAEEVFLGRQPILGRSQSLYAFELLFRSGPENRANVIDNVAATSVVIAHTLSEFGIDAVLGQYTGFINCDASFLHSDVIELLPPDRVVLEILETTIADEAILKRCKELQYKGFKLALDDFQGIHPRNRGFLEVVDIVKVDILGLGNKDVQRIVAELQPYRATLLAEKVETKERFDFCYGLGFDLYQGYFFSRGEKVTGKRLTTAQQDIVRLTRMVQNDEDIEKIVDAFKATPTLSVGLLRLTNSASMGLRHEVTSLRSAIVLLGNQQLQRWLLLLMMAYGGIMKNRQAALIHQAATRARFMELMALSNRAWAPYSESAFIAGMVSVMEATLGVSMEILVDSLGLSSEVSEALLEKKGILGDLLCLVEAIEMDDASRINEFISEKSKGNYDSLMRAQGQTIAWVNKITEAAF